MIVGCRLYMSLKLCSKCFVSQHKKFLLCEDLRRNLVVMPDVKKPVNIKCDLLHDEILIRQKGIEIVFI